MINKPHLQDLREQLARGRLALFLGGDLPREMTGLPSRADLARELAQRRGLPESPSLATVAQQVAQRGQRFEFTSFLLDRLDTAGTSPQPLQRRIVELVQAYPVGVLIVTAYDNLLELAFRESGVAINRVVRGGDVAFADPNRPTLIKLYGDLQQPDTLVVTEDDHYGLWRDRDKEDLLDEVRATLRRNAILFVGYTLTDPDFNLLWREVLDRAGRFALGAYAAWPDASEAQKQVWADRQVRVLDVPAVDLLGELLGTPQRHPPSPRSAAEDVDAATRPPAPFVEPSLAPTPAPVEPAPAPVTLTWLHLSDLHFRLPPAYSGDLLPYDANVVLRALQDDIAQRIQEDGLHPDFIAVTGDIAFSGKAKEYDLARIFLDDLLQTTGLSKGRLFLVPGNHDVDRKQISQGARSIATSLTDRASANEILANPPDRALMFARLAGYRTFVDDYLPGPLSFDNNANGGGYFYVQILGVAGQRIALLGLNSAWVAQGGDEDRGKLLLGERQVRAALDAADAAGANLRIAVMHHPFDWLREFDRDDSEAMLTDRCDFILHGHMHQVGLLQARGPDSNAMIIAAGACYETREHPNAYNLVRLDLDTRQGAVHLRTYSDKRGGFWTKDVMNYRNVPDGVYEFQSSS